MLYEKRKWKSWYRLVYDKFYGIVNSPFSPSNATTTPSRSDDRDTSPLSAGRRVRHVLRTIFNYPDAHAKLRSTAWLDGLRGIAAFEVVLYHYHLHFLLTGANMAYGSKPDTKQLWRLPFIKNFYSSGHAMVNVFFLISGFVLTQRSLMLIRSQQFDKLYPSISSAIFRRGVRIYLPAVVLSFVAMLMSYFGIKDVQHTIKVEYLHQHILDWFYACRDFVNPFHDYSNGFDIVHRYEHVMWTLPLEFYGSMVCYLAVMMVARVTHPVKRTAVVVLLIWFAVIKQNWWSTNFLIGMLHADFMIWQDKAGRSWTTSFAAKCCWAIVFIWACYVAGLPEGRYEEYKLPGFDWYYDHVPGSWKEIEGGGRFWWMVSGCSITIAVSQLPLLKRILEMTICQYLGRISFMLYLVHTFVYELVGKLWKGILIDIVKHEDVYIEEAKTTWRVPRGIGVYLVYFGFWIFMLPVLLVISGQVTKYVDDPSIRFAKWLEMKFADDDRKDVSPILTYTRVDTEMT